jgi:cyanate lyase
MTRIDPLDLAVTKVLRARMSGTSLTNGDLSAQSGIHLRTVIRIMTGQRAATVGELRAMAATLGTTTSQVALDAEVLVENA